MKQTLPRPRILAFILAVLSVFSPSASHCELSGLGPGQIDWSLVDLQDESGGWWKSFVIQSVPGVGYEIQTSAMLEDWQTVENYYGSGGPIHHALFETTEPSTIDPNLPPPLPSVAAPAVFFIMEKSSSGNIILNWRSLDSGTGVRYLTNSPLDPIWEEFDGLHFQEHGGYLMILSANIHSVSPDPALAPLSSADQAAANAFLSALPSIIVNIGDSMEAAMSNPPQAPDPSSRKFFRIRADWELDSDQDGRFDWEELITDGNNPFSADTDGDGTEDSQDIDLPLGAIPLPPGTLQRPPVATIQHRHVAGGRIEQLVGGLSTVFGFAYDSNGGEWTEHSEVEPFEDATSFGDVTDATSGLALPTWKNGVVSLEAKNMEQEIGSSGLFAREWVNFKTEYRLTLDVPAPQGGYRIPLTFGRVHWEWNESSHIWLPTPQPAGEADTFVLELVIPEGATESPAVPAPFLYPAANQAITLVPANVTILDGPGSLPADGLCVNTLQTFQLDFNGTERDEEDDLISEEWITWQSRRLKSDGTFDDWSTFRQGNFGPEVTGNLASVSSKHSGIFQVRAVLTPTNGGPMHFPAVRMRDATNAVDRTGAKSPVTRAGKEEYFGVVNEQKSLDVRNEAISWLGSSEYRASANVTIYGGAMSPLWNPSTKRADKCNIFVAHVLGRAAARVPTFVRWHFAVAAPLAREDWFWEPEENVDLDAYHWIDMGMTGYPFPGMVVSTSGAGSGHCAILDYDGGWIAAGLMTVNKYDSMADPTRQPHRTTRMRGYQSPF